LTKYLFLYYDVNRKEVIYLLEGELALQIAENEGMVARDKTNRRQRTQEPNPSRKLHFFEPGTHSMTQSEPSSNDSSLLFDENAVATAEGEGMIMRSKEPKQFPMTPGVATRPGLA
jgi:hypothetical protein